jgi:hypothetical protein
MICFYSISKAAKVGMVVVKVRRYLYSLLFLLLSTSVNAIMAQTPVTVNISPSKDNTIYERNVANSNGAGEFMIAGTTGSPYFNHALILFDIAGNIPANAIIQSAQLTLHLAGTSGHSDLFNIEMHRLTQNWGEGSSNSGTQAGQGAPATTGEATWANTFYPNTFWLKPGGDYIATPSAIQGVDNTGFYSWSSAQLVADVQNWLTTPEQNFGWLLKSDELNSFQAKKFESRESPVVANRPVLVVTYKMPSSKGQWTWVNGDSTSNNTSIYSGTLLNPAKPGARAYAQKWTDKSGNFWLFGGRGYVGSAFGVLNDLWKYNPGSNEWNFIKGDSARDRAGVYGSLGMANENNKPGSRGKAFNWTDSTGNLWLFGGFSPFTMFRFPTYYSDLWKYNPASNQWTWMKGDSTFNQPGHYGTKGIAAPANKPGNRANSVNWQDRSGNLWLFGGTGVYTINNVTGNGWSLQDLWKYNAATNEWAWMSGDSLPGSFSMNHGTKGVASPFTKPGPVQDAVSWTDSSGNFWLFGGQLADKVSNELWKFYPATNQWTWIFGDTTGNSPAVYGIKGIASGNNKPGARINAIGWTDADGDLWLFGGYGLGSVQSQTGNLGDLWKYNIQRNQWTWMSGSDVVNEKAWYAGKGVPSVINKPGSRYATANWSDQSGNLWLMGGTENLSGNTGYLLNDLWKYDRPSTANQSSTISISSPGNNAVFSAGSNIVLTATAADADGVITKVEFYNSGIKFAEDSTAPYGFSSATVEPGVYFVNAVARDDESGVALSDTVKITVTACTGSGSISGEGYSNIPGTQVANLTSNPAYPNNPSVTAQLSSFEYTNMGDNYGGRLRGYICAPQTGNYIFYIAGDDQAGLFLSTNEDSVNKTLIAYNISPVGFRAWTATATQKSAPVHLLKGARYYIETLHKQSAGANHLSVGWVLPNGVAEGPIPGSRLSPYIAPLAGRHAIEFAAAMRSEQPIADPGTKLTVVAVPNPSADYFTLYTSSNSGQTLSLKIIDATGRVLESRINISANGNLKIGSKLPAGIYFVEVTQGTQKEVLRLVKQ